MTKILGGYFEKRFLEWEKMAKEKIFRYFLYSKFFHVFNVQFQLLEKLTHAN